MSLEYTGLLIAYNPKEQRLARLNALGNQAGLSIEYDPIFCMYPGGNDFAETFIAIGYPGLQFQQTEFEVEGMFSAITGYRYDVYVDNNSNMRYRLRITDDRGIYRKCILYQDPEYDQASGAQLATYTFKFDETISLSSNVTNIGRIVRNGNPIVKTYFGLKIDSTGTVILVLDSPVAAGGTPKHLAIINEMITDPWITKTNSIISDIENKINEISSDTKTKYCSR